LVCCRPLATGRLRQRVSERSRLGRREIDSWLLLASELKQKARDIILLGRRQCANGVNRMVQ
jgi:hypothetical protein